MYRLIMLMAVLLIPAVGFSTESDIPSVGVEDSSLTAPDSEEVLGQSGAEHSPEPVDAPLTRVQNSFGKLPLYFIENQGQMDEEVAYYVKGADKTLYFTETGITFAITERKERSPSRDLFSIDKPESAEDACESDEELKRWIVKMDFVGANLDVTPRGEDQQEAVFSYFKGKPGDWNTGIPTYSKIVYEDLWPGIDLVYYGTVNQLKYDFIVKPGADPNIIRFAITGASDVVLDESGIIEVNTPLGSFQDEKPTAYQEIDGSRLDVPVAYSLDRSGSDVSYSIGFEVGKYDPRGSLVIDPAILVYCGYIGGVEYDVCYGITVDQQGNAYLTGVTSSSESDGFPVKVGPDLTSSGVDTFVAKLAATGTELIYCGYIGGTDEDVGTDVAIDAQGNAYVYGFTLSSEDQGFPVKVGPDLTFNPGGWYPIDTFVAKITPTGDDLCFCGYIGGNEVDFGISIDVDEQGYAYVTGATESSETKGFPVAIGPDLTFNGNMDIFVAKVAALGTHLEYCGYIGGTDFESDPVSIAVDKLGNAYVAGSTQSGQSEGFPIKVGPDLTINGDYDIFVAKVAATGAELEYCGYIGGADEEYGRGVAVDETGCAYITGETYSSQNEGFPVLVGPDLTYNGAHRDAFVAKVAASGAHLVYCGFIGGNEWDTGYGVAVDQEGSAYVTGRTFSSEFSFPVKVGPDLTRNGPWGDAFVAKVAASGTLLDYCGYIGGSDLDEAYAVAIDGMGNAYVAGRTYSDDIPVLIGPDLTFNGPSGDADAFVAKVATRGLFCNGYSLAAATVGAVEFNLLAGVNNASNEFLLVAGISGSSPGVTLPTGLVLPINWDFVSDLSVLLNNTIYFFDFMGTLDADGSASARLEWPGIPGSAGLSLYFAFCTRDPDEGFNFVSNPVEIELVP
ncbi:MAG: SBBP repeat-containing protein [Planctomycetota bacterium]